MTSSLGDRDCSSEDLTVERATDPYPTPVAERDLDQRRTASFRSASALTRSGRKRMGELPVQPAATTGADVT
jgi:hypothetical protein